MKTISTKKKKYLTFVQVDGWQAFVLFYENKLMPLEKEEITDMDNTNENPFHKNNIS